MSLLFNKRSLESYYYGQKVKMRNKASFVTIILNIITQ
jgi:hypothetical protein